MPYANLFLTCEECGARYNADRPTQRFCSRQCFFDGTRLNEECTVDGCTTPAKARGWCPKHWKRWRAHGDPLADHRRKPSLSLCAVAGCANKICAKGLCNTHYARMRRGADLDSPLRSDHPVGCTVPGCDRPWVAEGMCQTHRLRSLEGRPLFAPIRTRNPLPPSCTIDGCDRQPVARSMCSLHYSRAARGRDPRQDHPLCRVCTHPSAELIELMASTGVAAARISSDFHGVTDKSVLNHMSHAAAPKLRPFGCVVCQHPEVEDIDEWLMARARAISTSVTSRGTPRKRFASGPFTLPAIADRFGVEPYHLKTHAKPEHQQRRALYQLGRLNALKETA